MAVVHVTYFTDPADPWSWAAEPTLRRLQAEFGDEVRITYVMGGRAREITDPLHELLQALEASSASGMPVDARIWNGRRGGRAPTSTYPASLGVKAAAEPGRDGDYLRVLREGFMVDLERARGIELPTFAVGDERISGRVAPEAPARLVADAGAQAELWRLAMEFRARPERILAGELWGPPA